jgi:uncharacterized protein
MTSDGESPILAALYHRRPDDAERLADTAATLTVFEAAALGRESVLRELLRQDPDAVNAFAPDGFFPLALAAFFAPASTVHLLLEAGARVDAASRNGMQVQPLHSAVAARNPDAVRSLLDRGADPNARQQVGYTPLMAAAGSGREDLVALLLERGADPALVSEDGRTAAALAREHGHHALAARLDPA